MMACQAQRPLTEVNDSRGLSTRGARLGHALPFGLVEPCVDPCGLVRGQIAFGSIIPVHLGRARSCPVHIENHLCRMQALLEGVATLRDMDGWGLIRLAACDVQVRLAAREQHRRHERYRQPLDHVKPRRFTVLNIALHEGAVFK